MTKKSQTRRGKRTPRRASPRHKTPLNEPTRGPAAPIPPQLPALTRCLRLSRRGAGSSPCWGAGNAVPTPLPPPPPVAGPPPAPPGPARLGLTAWAAERRPAPCSRPAAPPPGRMRRPPPPHGAAPARLRRSRAAILGEGGGAASCPPGVRPRASWRCYGLQRGLQGLVMGYACQQGCNALIFCQGLAW